MGKKRAANLRWFLHDGPAQALMEEWGDSWDEGLCWILAEGLLQWITSSPGVSPETVLLLVLGDAKCPAHHVVVCVLVDRGGKSEKQNYLDSDGANTKATLLRTWRDLEGLQEPFLAAYDEQLLLNYEIPRDQRKSARLVEYLTNTFGPFSPSFLDK